MTACRFQRNNCFFTFLMQETMKINCRINLIEFGFLYLSSLGKKKANLYGLRRKNYLFVIYSSLKFNGISFFLTPGWLPGARKLYLLDAIFISWMLSLH